MARTEFSWLWTGRVMDSCKQSYGNLGYIKSGKFLINSVIVSRSEIALFLAANR
jgi:hypothetical protein